MFLSAVISLNGACNSRCVYCDSWRSPVTGPHTDQWLKIIEQLPGLGVRHLSFSGGEPLLRGDLPILVRRARELGLVTQVLTNGILLHGQAFRESIENGLEWVCLSLDTLDEATYRRLRGVRLAPILAGLEQVLQYREANPGLAISLKCVLSRLNLEQVGALLALAKEKDIWLGFQPFHPYFVNAAAAREMLSCRAQDAERITAALDAILSFKSATGLVINQENYLRNFTRFMTSGQQPEDFTCEAADWVVTVDNDLNLKPCWMLPPVGSLQTEPLDSLWGGEALEAARKKMRVMHCRNCWLTCHSDLHITQRA